MTRARVPARVKRYRDELAATERELVAIADGYAELERQLEELRMAYEVRAARVMWLAGWLAKAEEAP